jgi:hypothetical protein
MAIGGFPARCALAARVLAGGALLGGTAEAATIYNFSFVQTGYETNPASDLPPFAATLSGMFSGTLNAVGSMDLTTLTDYHLTFTYADSAGTTYINGGLPEAFSYHPGDNGSLAIIQGLSNGNEACVGIVVGFLCGGGNALGAVKYDFNYTAPIELSYEAPIVTLVSTTPLPATLPLFASALGGLALIARRRRRSGALR